MVLIFLSNLFLATLLSYPMWYWSGSVPSHVYCNTHACLPNQLLETRDEVYIDRSRREENIRKYEESINDDKVLLRSTRH